MWYNITSWYRLVDVGIRINGLSLVMGCDCISRTLASRPIGFLFQPIPVSPCFKNVLFLKAWWHHLMTSSVYIFQYVNPMACYCVVLLARCLVVWDNKWSPKKILPSPSVIGGKHKPRKLWVNCTNSQFTNQRTNQSCKHCWARAHRIKFRLVKCQNSIM